MTTLTADLELDVSSAVDAATSSLGPAIESTLQSAADSFLSAMQPVFDQASNLQVTPNVADLGPEITSALQSADTVVNPQIGDPALLGSEVSQAIDQNTTIQPQVADPAALGAEVTDALQASADSTPIVPQVDTSEAVSQVQDLGSAADTAAGPVSSLGDATTQVQTGSKLAAGEIGGLAGITGSAGASMGLAVGGATALAAGLDKLVEKGIAATSSEERLTLAFGNQAKAVLDVNIGGLNGNLDKLGEKVGSTSAQVEGSVARLGQYATTAGFSSEATKTYAQNVEALALRATALNPALGSVDEVVQRMGRGLATGGRFAQQFFLNLDRKDIVDRASEMFGKAAADLTQTEKSAAGASLAVERLGGKLGTDFSKGAESADNKARSLKASLDNALETIAKPIVAPFLDVMQQMIPVGTSLGSVLGELGTSVLPVVSTSAAALGPALGVIADAMNVLQPVIQPVVEGLIAFEVASFLPTLTGAIATGFLNLAVTAPAAEGALLGVAGASEGLGVAISGIAGPIGIVVGVLGFAAGALGLFGGAASNTADDVKKYSESSDEALRATVALQQAQDILAAGGLGSKTLAEVEALQRLKDVADQNIGTAERLGAALVDMGVAKASMVNAILDQAAQKHRQLAIDQAANAETASSLSATTGQSAESARAEAAAFSTADQAAKDLKTSMDDLIGRSLNQFEAHAKLTDAEYKLAGSLQAQKGMLDINSLSAGQNATELSGAVKAAEAEAEALQKVGDTQGATTTMQTFTQSLVDMLLQAQVSPTAIGTLITQLGLVGSVSPQVAAMLGITAGAFGQLPGSALAAASGVTSALGTIPSGARSASDQTFAAMGSIGQALNTVPSVARSASDATFAAMGSIPKNASSTLQGTAAAVTAGGQQISTASQKVGADSGQQFQAGIGPAFKAGADAGVAQADAGLASNDLGSHAHGLGVAVGVSFDDGMASGLNDHSGIVSAAAEAVVSNAKAAADRAAAAHSPSMLFAELGMNIAAGLAMGMSSGPAVATVNAGAAQMVNNVSLDSAEIGRAIAAAIPGGGGQVAASTGVGGGVTLIVVNSPHEAIAQAPTPAQPALSAFLSGRG